MSAPSPLLTLMIAAAHAAGDGLMRDFAAIDRLDVRHKNGPADPFSEADLRAEDTVRTMLSRAEPDFGFLGEEGGLTEGRDSSHVWIVDPLDGTANFLTGLPIFAVNIALARDGKVIAGVTHIPTLGETFRAERGHGAFLGDKQIRISSRGSLVEAVVAVGIPFHGKPRHAQFAAEMERLTPRIGGIRRLGAGAVDLAYVACGRLDAYWEQSVSAWDIAAGVILVEEAGGIVTDTLGRDLDLGGGTMLAATPAIHADLLEALSPVDDPN